MILTEQEANELIQRFKIFLDVVYPKSKIHVLNNNEIVRVLEITHRPHPMNTKFKQLMVKIEHDSSSKTQSMTLNDFLTILRSKA